MKEYTVEFESTTYRTYTVWGDSETEAVENAHEELQLDTDVSRAWVENAEITRVNA